MQKMKAVEVDPKLEAPFVKYSAVEEGVFTPQHKKITKRNTLVSDAVKRRMFQS